MDPITSIVTALALGAAAGLKPTVTQAIKDGYAGLKALIQRKYAKVGVDQLEANPMSQARRGVVTEDLETTDIAKDEEVLRQAKALLEAIQSHAPETAGAIGVDLEDVKGAALTIADIIATGTGVRATHVEASGDITIQGVRAGARGEAPPKV